MTGYFETLDRIKPPTMRPAVQMVGDAAPGVGGPLGGWDQVQQEQAALVIDARDRTVVTVPIDESGLHEEAGLDQNNFITRLRGQLVGAEEANRNGQFWATGDLNFGIGSVAHGPLNWLHQGRHIIGCLTEAQMRTAQQADGKQRPPHIEAESMIWSWIYPNETRIIREAAATSGLYYSMECISREVQCVGPNGCNRKMAYLDAYLRNERACEHVRAKAAVRRLINPVFQGAAVIVPPIAPGWADAHADVVQKASHNESIMRFTAGDELLAAQILAFAASPRS